MLLASARSVLMSAILPLFCAVCAALSYRVFLEFDTPSAGWRAAYGLPIERLSGGRIPESLAPLPQRTRGVPP